jgi:hypothetical protein
MLTAWNGPRRWYDTPLMMQAIGAAMIVTFLLGVSLLLTGLILLVVRLIRWARSPNRHTPPDSARQNGGR